MLNISDQMIRYYEKEGVISPRREGEGKYRYYSVMDIFLIYEAMKYKEWDISLKDIKSIVDNEYFDTMVLKMEEFCKHLESKIYKEQILLKRIEEVKNKLFICKYNIGNYWIEKAPGRYIYYSNRANGDDYELISIDQNMQKSIYGNETISYFDVMVRFKNGYEEWYYSIDKEYHDLLGIRDYGQYLIQPPQLCLCTVIDMGKIGDFNGSSINSAVEYAKGRGYEIISDIYGTIIGRGNTKGEFNRLLFIHLPIKSL